jgi:hypothetical protein
VQETTYSVSGQWPKFESLGELFDWLIDQRTAISAQSSENGDPENCPVFPATSREEFSALSS